MPFADQEKLCCRACGYDLRGHDGTVRRCPECGAANDIADMFSTPSLGSRFKNWMHRWSWIDALLLGPLVACSAALWYRTLTLRRPLVGYEAYVPIAFLGAVCFTYLSARYHPMRAYRVGGRLARAVLVVVLCLLWVVLFRAWSFDQYFCHLLNRWRDAF